MNGQSKTKISIHSEYQATHEAHGCVSTTQALSWFGRRPEKKYPEQVQFSVNYMTAKSKYSSHSVVPLIH